MSNNLILTIGNNMMGDDGAGPLLAELLQQHPVPDWDVLDGGATPENVMHQVQTLQPRKVVVVDAAEMDLKPGEMRFVDERCLAELFMMTTHNLPVSFLLERLREFVDDVSFLGIQPEMVAFYYPMSPLVRQSVMALHEQLLAPEGLQTIPWLVLADDVVN